ncbi:hypothetical protein K461DRAFT_316133 [Myriangium duriaei CBS 260.36]|uniref:Uncharacterized protein n=1 Tax=Myriangium duriaei CBS 260.36 TaxID=1168546 RepID=A0A9P4IT95_9PEZI|nr:hypothetical protein K461DRAFT_316133 [Myriangium duriaei CBS 260.36]
MSSYDLLMDSHDENTPSIEKPPIGLTPKDRLSHISWTLFFAIFPMIVLTITFLVFVFKYRVDVLAAPYPHLAPPSLWTEFGGHYYLSLSATFITQVSWTSSVAPICATMLLTLASYPICKSYLVQTQREGSELPTPFQLSLVIRFFNGGPFGALWSWASYCRSWRQTRRRQSSPVRQVVAVTLCVTTLSFLAFLSDTWLHNSTKAVNAPVFTPPPPLEADFGLTDHFLDCTGPNASSCILGGPGTNTLFDAKGSQLVLNNDSLSTVTVLPYTDDRGTFSYFHSAWGDNTAHRSVDYTAFTYGLQTQCRPVTNQYNLVVEDSMTPFSCSPVFSETTRDFTGDTFFGVYFSDSSMAELSKQFSVPVNNTFFFAYYSNFATVTSDDRLSDDPDLVRGTHGGSIFILFCQATVLDIHYDSINGSIARFHTSPSNTSVTNLIKIPMAFSDFSTVPLEASARKAATDSGSSSELAQNFAKSYSLIALATSGQIVTTRLAVFAQGRTIHLLTAILPGPLYTFVAVNMAFVVVGIVLAIWAARVVSDPNVHDLQSRLSVAGLAAQHFDPIRARRIMLFTWIGCLRR